MAKGNLKEVKAKLLGSGKYQESLNDSIDYPARDMAKEGRSGPGGKTKSTLDK